MSHLATLKTYLPWIQTPLVVNAPMSGSAKSKLAIAVTRSGGLGQIGFLDDMHELSTELETTKKALQESNFDTMKTLPISLGVIVLVKKQEKAGEIMEEVRGDARKYLERASLCL
jgi:nitronate monooxygenase